MPAAMSRRDLLAALVVVIVWGTNFVAMKIGLRELTPFQMGAGRYLFALLPLVLFIRPPRLPWQWVLLYGLCQGVGQFGLLFLSLRAGMSASLASVLLQTQVFFTALLGFALLREPVGRALLAGMALAALGLGCFAVNYVASGAGDVTVAGLLLVLGAAAMWAASNIVVRLARRAAPTGWHGINLRRIGLRLIARQRAIGIVRRIGLGRPGITERASNLEHMRAYLVPHQVGLAEHIGRGALRHARGLGHVAQFHAVCITLACHAWPFVLLEQYPSRSIGSVQFLLDSTPAQAHI